jgi:hypothetical protein
MTSSYYDNCEIVHKDGTCLGHCDRKKFNWYVNNNLAEKINDSTIKLLFEPKMISNKINTIKRENKCCGCCTEEQLRKFHVVPAEFKKLFPIENKSHNSTDIVLLCPDCVSDANFFSDLFKKELEDEYGINKTDFIDKDKEKLKLTAIRYLKKYEISKIHDKANDIVKYIEQELIDQLGYKPELDEIKNLTNIDIVKKTNDASSVAQYIVNNVLKENKLDEFVMRWKNYYLKKMEPEYIPADFI